MNVARIAASRPLLLDWQSCLVCSVLCLAHLSQLWPHARDPRGFERLPRVLGYHRLHLPYAEGGDPSANGARSTGDWAGRWTSAPGSHRRPGDAAKDLHHGQAVAAGADFHTHSGWDVQYLCVVLYDRNDSSRLPRPVNIVGDHLDARDRVSPEGVDVKPATWVTTWLFVCQPGPERMGAQHRCTRVYCTLSPASCRMPIGGRGPMQAGIAAARRVLQNGLL